MLRRSTLRDVFQETVLAAFSYYILFLISVLIISISAEAISICRLCGLCMVLYVFYCTMYCTNPAFGCQILINFLSCLVLNTAHRPGVVYCSAANRTRLDFLIHM